MGLNFERTPIRIVVKDGAHPPPTARALLARTYRREHRFACTQTDISVSLDAGVPALSASVTEVSRNGLRIELEREMRVGAYVDVAFERLLVKGMIRYCRSISPGRFEVGLLIREAAPQPQL